MNYPFGILEFNKLKMAPEVGLVPILLFLGWILHSYSTLPQPGSALFFTTLHYHLLAIPLAMILCRTMNKKPHQGERVTLSPWWGFLFIVLHKIIASGIASKW